MRLSSFIIYDRVVRSMQENLTRLGESHLSIATGKRINRPSQDVTGAVKALDYRVRIDESEQYIRNIDDARAYLELTETVLAGVGDALTRAKELSLAALNGDESAETRAIMAKEVDGLREHLLGRGNTRFRGRYIFSGFLTDTPAFDGGGLYQGDGNYIEIMTGPDLKVKENITGEEAFAYTQEAEETVETGGGGFIHYIPGGGTTVTVEIRASDDTTVLDTFSFSSFIELLDILARALEADDTGRVNAILKPLDDSLQQTLDVRAEVGARLDLLEAEKRRLADGVFNLKTVLSETEDADITEVIAEMSRTEVALQALRETGARILSQSLMDFLR